MSENYQYDVLDLPEIPDIELKGIQEELKQLGTLCLNPLPPYQVFVNDVAEAFRDKVIVVARHNGKIVAFVSSIVIHIPELPSPVIHSGLTVIHPAHRRSFGVNQFMHANLWIQLLGDYPEGFWMTTLSEVISSLVHMTKYAVNLYPSPQWQKDHPLHGGPSELHRRIAAEISAKHRSQMLISSEATFDEENFIFRGSNNHKAGRVFLKDVDDEKHWHRDTETNRFYRPMFRKGAGDEVLQIGFMDPGILFAKAKEDRFRGKL